MSTNERSNTVGKYHQESKGFQTKIGSRRSRQLIFHQSMNETSNTIGTFHHQSKGFQTMIRSRQSRSRMVQRFFIKSILCGTTVVKLYGLLVSLAQASCVQDTTCISSTACTLFLEERRPIAEIPRQYQRRLLPLCRGCIYAL